MRILFSFRFLFSVACVAFSFLGIYTFYETQPDAAGVADRGRIKALQDTPEITRLIAVPDYPAPAFAMRAKLPHGSDYIGMAFTCDADSPSGLTITAFFGGFPQNRKPLQFAIRTEDGKVLRLGPVFTAGPESGFHSPQFTEASDVEPLLLSALRPNTLISNGYRSFWNRISPAENQHVRDTMLACLRRGA